MHRRFPTWLATAAALIAGVVVLAALTWLARWVLLHVAAYEDALGDVWYWVYLYVGYIALGLVIAVALLAALHNFRFGRRDARPHGTVDAVPWWSLLERLAHWVCVASFVVLLVTGVQLYIAGPGLPSDLTRLMRSIHRGDVFMVTGGLLFVLWFRDGLPRRYDLRWLAHLGGYLGYPGPLPAGRFNAGQKIWFWVAALAGLVMAVSGWQLAYNFTVFDTGYLTLLTLHLAAAAVFLCVLTGHVYLAVVMFRGALAGMIHGRIGRQAAVRFHSQAAALHAPPARAPRRAYRRQRSRRR